MARARASFAFRDNDRWAEYNARFGRVVPAVRVMRLVDFRTLLLEAASLEAAPILTRPTSARGAIQRDFVLTWVTRTCVGLRR